jgi:hypothetical protein
MSCFLKLSNYKNVLEFIDEIRNYDSIMDILDRVESSSDKGFVYERLWDIIIKCSACDRFTSDQYDHLIGQVNNGMPDILNDLKKYLKTEKVCSGNSTGISDISLLDSKNGHHIFMSSKYYTNEQSVDSYDISKIVNMADHNKHIYKNYTIFLLVKDKLGLLQKIKNAKHSNQYITKYMKVDHILDINDLNQYFQVLKQFLNQYTFDQFNAVIGKKQKHIKYRFHQKLLIDCALRSIDKGHKKILYGCKPRSGKTYIGGGLMIELMRQKLNLNVLLITTAPKETLSQWREDLFDNHVDFNSFNRTDICTGKDFEKIDLTQKNHLISCSKQILDYHFDHPKLKQIHFDLLIYDENHNGGTTNKAEISLETYLNNQTIRVYLTATYRKVVVKWEIPQECQLYWDIEDETWCKSQNVSKLIAKFGEHNINNTLEYFKKRGESIDETFNYYKSCPHLYYLTTMFDSDRYYQIKKKIKDSKYGFSMKALFSLLTSKAGQSTFQFPSEVSLFLSYISGSNKEQDFKNGDQSFFGRIKNISLQQNSRTTLSNQTFTTQAWYLPFGEGQLITDVSECLKNAMLNDNILKHFEIIIMNSNPKYKVTSPKKEIAKHEINAKNNGKRGLIILLGKMCTLGITLSLCDVVMMLNDIEASDSYYQMIYRCLTESTKGDKPYGFVVDLNYSRMITSVINCLNSTKTPNPINIEEKIKYVINNNLINIDIDMFKTQHHAQEQVTSKLIELWKNDPVNSFSYMMNKLKSISIPLEKQDQDLINQSFQNQSTEKPTKRKTQIHEHEQLLPNGLAQEPPNNKISKEEIKSKIIILKPISLTKDIYPYIIPLICILTLRDSKINLMDMLVTIKNDQQLSQIFNSQVSIWWQHPHHQILNTIEFVLNKYKEFGNIIYTSASIFKANMMSLIDQPNQLLELINSCLKPKIIEKTKHAEVFTPMEIINEMLDQLPQGIWSNPNLKWLDPANGMGNFPVAVYLRLMDGLENVMPDQAQRKRHILENMLYMVELNQKNVHVCQQIFDLNNQYKLNIHQGNFLNFDWKWQHKGLITEYDIVLGNPPYNDEQKSTGSSPLYNKFIERVIDHCQYLLMIVPSKWFTGGKGLDKFRQMMFSRKDIVCVKHYDNASNIFESVDIKGGVNYFLKDKNYHGLWNYNSFMIDPSINGLIEPKCHSLISKLSKYPLLITRYRSQNHYKIETNDPHLMDDCHDLNQNYLCYVSEQKGLIKYISQQYVTADVSSYKILVPDGAYGHGSGFGRRVLAKPGEVHSKTFISFDVKDECEAKSLFSYLNCRLPNFLLSLLKGTQHTSNKSCKLIPLPPLDRNWTNISVNQYFQLSNDEIELLNQSNFQFTDQIDEANKNWDSLFNQPKIKLKLKLKLKLKKKTNLNI